jgi:transcriptional regulator with XRE-family HTH domain
MVTTRRTGGEAGGRADDERLMIARALRDELARRRMTQESLAALTGLSLATIGRVLRGSFRPQSIVLIESKLEVSLSGAGAESSRVAAPEYGSYHYETVAHLVGDYLLVRRAFSRGDTIVLYPLSVRWRASPGGLEFEEKNRVGRSDYSQKGFVHIPPGCAYLHLATIDKGSVRLMTVSFVADTQIAAEPMRGLILTLYNPVASTHMPAVSAVVLVKLGEADQRRNLPVSLLISDPRSAPFLSEIETAERQQVACAIGRPGV